MTVTGELLRKLAEQADAMGATPSQVLASSLVGHAAVDLNLELEDLLEHIRVIWIALSPAFPAMRASKQALQSGQTTLDETIEHMTAEGLSILNRNSVKS